MTSRISYAYRDKSYFSDDNRGYILEQNILDAGIDIIPANGPFSIGLYGKNLLDEVKHGGDSQLPSMAGFAAACGAAWRHVLPACKRQNLRSAADLQAQELIRPAIAPRGDYELSQSR